MVKIATRALFARTVEYATVGTRMLHVHAPARPAPQEIIVNITAAQHARVTVILTTPDIVRATRSGGYPFVSSATHLIGLLTGKTAANIVKLTSRVLTTEVAGLQELAYATLAMITQQIALHALRDMK